HQRVLLCLEACSVGCSVEADAFALAASGPVGRTLVANDAIKDAPLRVNDLRGRGGRDHEVSSELGRVGCDIRGDDLLLVDAAALVLVKHELCDDVGI